MKNIWLLSIFACILILMSCSTSDDSTSRSDDLVIYTSLYPIQYIVENLVTDSTKVHTIFPPGVDAHTYEPTTRDMTKIAKSDLFIYLGAGMEAFSEKIADALISQPVTVVEIGANHDLFHEMDHADHEGHDHGDHDPHIWLDPLRMIEIAKMIVTELSELQPENKALFEDNLHNLEEQLIKLDEKFIKTLQTNPNKEILVSHAAFGYWEERYGIKQIAINGISTSSEPSQKDLIAIIEQAEKQKLNYILFEQNTSNRVTEIIQEHIDAVAVTVHNLAVLREEDIKNDLDYIKIMEQNLLVLDKITK